MGPNRRNPLGMRGLKGPFCAAQGDGVELSLSNIKQHYFICSSQSIDPETDAVGSVGE